nr:SMC-Scp complex subunit ScpB [Terrimicrobiaceae bacterium]
MKKRKKNKTAAETPAPEVTLAEEFGETETPETAPVAETPEETFETSEESPEPGDPAPADAPAVAEGSVDGDVPASEAAGSAEIPGDGDAVSEEPAGDVPFPLSQIVEAILFASQKPVSAKELIGILKSAAEAGKENPLSPAAPYAKVKEAHLREAIEELENACMDPARTYEVRENAAGWQLVTKANFSPWLRQLYPENRSARMSAPAMETLAIIAYRQPITRADIEAVRGVAVDGVMQTLLDRGLVKIAGRAEVPGRPLLYETTQHFMEHFGLKNLDDLPNAGELRTIKLPQADGQPLPDFRNAGVMLRVL